MDSWGPIAKLQKCDKWLQFSCMRKFLNLHLPHFVEVVSVHKGPDALISFKHRKRWDVTLVEAHTEEMPSPDTRAWSRGVQFNKTGSRFVVILCKGNWHRGVVVDLRAAYHSLHRVKHSNVVLPWVRKGQFFETFASLSELWGIIASWEGINEQP